MFQNIFKIAVRILFRNKIYSAVNLLGLSIGIACSLLILIFVWHQVTFDRFHENLKNIFLVQQKMDLGSGEYTTDRSGGAYAQALKEGFPEVENTARIAMVTELLLAYYPDAMDSLDQATQPDQKKFIEELVIATDSSFFQIFTFPLLRGDPQTALKEPYSIVITKEMAEKYFGDEDPMDRIIRINQKYDFKVTGVADEYPDNSTIRFDFLIPFPFIAELGSQIDSYYGNPYFTFLLLNNSDHYKSLSDQLPEFFSKLFDDDIIVTQKLLPFSKMNFYGESHGFYPVLILSILAFLILMIACINFMNLSTARFLTRTREVGIRKVVGASRPKLIRQFIGESMIMAFLSVNIAILVVDIILPTFNQLLGAKLTLDLKNPVFIILLIILMFLTGIIAGSYPAFFLSSFRPADVLKKDQVSGSRGGRLRKVLVVVQFIFSFIFIIGTIGLYKQFNYMQTSKLGVNRENILYLPVRGELTDNYHYMKQELLNNTDILSVTSSSQIPVFADRGETKWGLHSEDQNDLARILYIGYDFEKTFGINLEEGRSYSTEFAGDSIEKIIVNKAAIRKLDLDTAIGKTIYLLEKPYTIIGMTDDFISFPVDIGGEILLLPFQEVGNFIFIKTRETRQASTLSFIENIHEKFNPDFPFIYFYMDDYLDPISKTMDIAKKIILFFTFFGIFISILGLFGLSTFSIEQKTKEISIRKAMGASIRRILLMVNTEFLKLVCIGFLIALPLSIVLVNLMLKGFSRTIELGPGIFIYTGLLMLVISSMTILYQALRAATRNPAESLRYE